MRSKLVKLFENETLAPGNNYSKLLDVRFCYSWIVCLEWASSITGTLNVERVLNEDLNETLISFPIGADKTISGSSGKISLTFTEIEPAPYLRVVLNRTSGATDVNCYAHIKGG